MKKLLMVLRVAVSSLTAHTMRTVLTMLGIVIGVAAVIALVGVGTGAQAQVVSQFQSLGSNLVTVTAMPSYGFSQSGLQQSSRTLTMKDVSAIKSLATSVSLVAPLYSTNATVTYGGSTTSTTINGVTEEYGTVRNTTVTRGRFLTQADNDNMAMVVVLGTSVVEDLFGSSEVNAIGETVRINRQNYQVIGVLKSKGQSGPQNQDDVIMMPLRTAQLKLGGAGTNTVRSINLQVRTADEMDLAQAQVTAILRSLHGLATGADNDFLVQNQADILSSVAETSGTFTTLLGSIAAISLLVGGIGIMNIMLVSVTERTREIGLRKAVGAKRGDILTQFLTEAIVISVLGGIIGVVLGVVGAQVITPLLGSSQAIVTTQSVVLALAVSLAIGVFFGLYPANRAAGLNPIDALRYE
ncbi:ABC transporter permease [Candidatus Amarolinea aalborgensis]|jgi:putative ABC transport system permease protein|uniref:ABC transporter permease n=1 Tax=Candidatus Amarolinea aalborgensis TaxID=2249329 RepID=UPI003BF97788